MNNQSKNTFPIRSRMYAPTGVRFALAYRMI